MFCTCKVSAEIMVQFCALQKIYRPASYSSIGGREHSGIQGMEAKKKETYFQLKSLFRRLLYYFYLFFFHV